MGMTREECRAYVENTPESIDDILKIGNPEEEYDAGGRYVCRAFLREYESHPHDLPASYLDWDEDVTGPHLPDAGFTGHQVAYAIRMARYILLGV